LPRAVFLLVALGETVAGTKRALSGETRYLNGVRNVVNLQQRREWPMALLAA
jgi:hypothetical protein